jgi:uncharacterized Zn finger protein
MALQAERVRALLRQEPRRSMFRCTECGSFLETRLDRETGRVSRKCVSCAQWYPLAGVHVKALKARV